MSFSIRDGQSEVTGDFSKLEALIAGLSEPHHVDIGVFATAKTGSGAPIATYGAYNEFGSVKVKDRPPKRSFIRMPLSTRQDKISAYVAPRAKAHLEDGDVKAIFADIGIAGESQIQEAFDTRGFGTWKENAPSTVESKGSDAPLIDDGTLRAAVTHRVDGGES